MLLVALAGCRAQTVVAPATEAAAPAITLTDGPAGWFEVRDILPASLADGDLPRDQWAPVLSVHVDDETGTTPALLGAYSKSGNTLRFKPTYGLMPGVGYKAVYNADRQHSGAHARSAPIVARFTLPKPVTAPPTVTAVFPTRDVLPENLLKFYIHFSQPMSRGEAYRRIRLLDDAGKEVPTPFLELDEELWDPSGTRLTLFFDPGRIKRGLKPREDVGPTLEEDKSYTLVIDRKWPDAHGNLLKQEHRKSFRATFPDDAQPNPRRWKLTPPPAAQTKPLEVRSPKPLDHALLHRMLWITDAAGQNVPGKIVVLAEETTWQFLPDKPWQPGTYSLVIDTALEDLSGNSVARPFEVDVQRPIQANTDPKTLSIPFDIK